MAASGLDSPARLLDRELDLEAPDLLGCSNACTCVSTSGLVWALGVADQSLDIGAIDVCIGGGETGLWLLVIL